MAFLLPACRIVRSYRLDHDRSPVQLIRHRIELGLRLDVVTIVRQVRVAELLDEEVVDGVHLLLRPTAVDPHV